MAARNVPDRRGGWPGKTMGVVGLGRIGRRIADRAKAIGMDVAYYGRKAQPGVPYEFVGDIGALAEKSDVLALACPGGKETHHLVNAAVIGKLGPGGYLVNVSRGSVVDEAALLDALENKKIAGAALDVFASEPNIDARFLPLENVVLQPHNASITHETRTAMVARILSDIDAFLNDQKFHDAAKGGVVGDLEQGKPGRVAWQQSYWRMGRGRQPGRGKKYGR